MRRAIVLITVVVLAGCGATKHTELRLTGKTKVVTVKRLPDSEYATIRPACATAHKRLVCAAVGLEPVTAEAKSLTHPVATPSITERVPLAVPVDRAGSPVPVLPALTPGEGAYGITAKQMAKAYEVPEGTHKAQEEEQTIALLEEYADPWGEQNLNQYSREMGIPECKKPCYKTVTGFGSEVPNRPLRSEAEAEEALLGKTGATYRAIAQEAKNSSLETAIDIEAAHAMCWYCKIAVVVFPSTQEQASFYTDMGRAVQAASKYAHATVMSSSYIGKEIYTTSPTEAQAKAIVTEQKAQEHFFNVAKVPILNASGDWYYERWAIGDAYAINPGVEGIPEGGVCWPCNMKGVVTVGGTQLFLKANGEREREEAWFGAGSGCSYGFPAPAWQTALANWATIGCATGNRLAESDISAEAGTHPAMGILTPFGWHGWAGTSLSAPLIAGMWANAGGGISTIPIERVYSRVAAVPGRIRDITEGNNAEPGEWNNGTGKPEGGKPSDCGSKAICKAGVGWDGPSGLGVPKGLEAFK